MNKKFSTLLVGALLASSVGAFAQDGTTPTTTAKFTTSAFSDNDAALSVARYYALKDADDQYIGVQPSSDGGTFQFKSLVDTELDNLAMVDSFLWKITTVTVDGGFTRFSLENKATGVIFSFNKSNAVLGSVAATAASKTIGGVAQWKWLDSRFGTNLSDTDKTFTVDYANGDSVMAVKKASDGVLYVAKDHKKNAGNLEALKVSVVEPGSWVMSAVDLNTKGDAVKYMQLTFDGSAATVANNPFADKYQVQTIATKSEAKKFELKVNNNDGKTTTDAPDTDWLLLNKIGTDGKVSNKFAHVDTSYFKSKGETYKTYNPIKVSSNAKLVETGKDILGENLPMDAFRFKFTKDLMTDSIKIESQGSFIELKEANTTAAWLKTDKVTFWSMHTEKAKLYSTLDTEKATDAKDNTRYTVLSHCTLEGETSKVVTFYTDDKGKAEDNYVNLYTKADGISDDFMSIPAGVYKIQNVKTKEFYGVHIYTTDSVADWTGKAAIDNMEFDHIPAFQWVVYKTDLSSDERELVSPVFIANREFVKNGDGTTVNTFNAYQLRKGENYDPHKLIGMFNGVEVEFIPVAASSVSNKYLGYKNFTNAELEFNGYNFNYWHPYAQDRYLNVNKTDTILNVLTTDAGRFTIEGTTTNDVAYGYTPSAAAKAQITGLEQLYRRAYTVSLDGKAIYQNAEGQFVVTKDAAEADTEASFYFKENNEFEKAGETVCYYALIAQNINTKAGVRQNDDKALLLSEVLTEISTATFDIQEDNLPLYRRFNTQFEGVEEGDANLDAAKLLKFHERYVNDYLMDETNPFFKREGMAYLGIARANEVASDAGLSFKVRPYNIGKSPKSAIKPQYLIIVAEGETPAKDAIICKEDHKHYDVAAGEETDDPMKCFHTTPAVKAINRYKLLVSFADSTDAQGVAEDEKLYTFGKYARVGFTDVAEQDSVMYILGNQFATVETEDLKIEDIQAKAVKTIDMKTDVKSDAHKDYTWSFRFIDPEKALVAEKEEDLAFLIESDNGDNKEIAPTKGAWIKNQNNCLVLSTKDAKFENAKTGGDNALIFNIEMGSEDDMATENEEISTSTVSVSAVNGGVVVKGAEGKTVVITNVLGQTVANTVITSNEATIAAPAGVVVVAVEGEAAVKAIVK